MSERLFTDEELREMGRRTLDVLQEAIAKGDREKAKELATRMYEEFRHLHNGYMFWVTGLLTHIYRNYGIDAVERAEREAHTIEGKTVFKPPKETDWYSRIKHHAKAMRGHLQPLTIEEDDEKVVITMKPCGSGEKIIEMGGYEAGLARVKDPHPITWGMKDFPSIASTVRSWRCWRWRTRANFSPPTWSPSPCATAFAISPSTKTRRRYRKSFTGASESRSRNKGRLPERSR